MTKNECLHYLDVLYNSIDMKHIRLIMCILKTHIRLELDFSILYA
jgi:hypothetical protein